MTVHESLQVLTIGPTTYVEGQPPWTFTCPVCGAQAQGVYTVVCTGPEDAHAPHRPTVMEREWIKVYSAMTGQLHYIEVLR